LLSLLLRDRAIAFLASLLFLIHPVHSEAVGYISARNDTLAALFMVAAMIFAVNCSRRNNARDWALACLSYLLALLSKEHSVVMPALLVLIWVILKERIVWRVLISLAFMSVAYLVFWFYIFRPSLNISIAFSSTPWQRLPGFFVAMLSYIKLMIMPLDLHMEYPNRLFVWSDWRVISGVFLIGAFLIVACRQKARNPRLLFGLGWFLTAILPVSNVLYPAGGIMAERYVYFPSIGLFLIMAVLLMKMPGRLKAGAPFYILAACILMFFHR